MHITLTQCNGLEKKLSEKNISVQKKFIKKTNSDKKKILKFSKVWIFSEDHVKSNVFCI